jgi:predicted  nucleic acid-binding Zn-ribbon protein
MASEMSAALSRLHELLRQLADAESTLAEGPRAAALAEKQVAAAEQQLEAQKLTIRSNRKLADELNLKLKSKESELQKLQGQLNTAASNKEYDIFKGQIDSAKKDRSSFEETALTALEEIDVSNVKLKELEKELKERKALVEAASKAYAAQRPEIEATIARLQSEIAAAEQTIPADAKAAFQRLRKAHGASALSDLDDEFCNACNGRVTNQDRVRIRMGEFVPCRACGRVLYIV